MKVVVLKRGVKFIFILRLIWFFDFEEFDFIFVMDKLNKGRLFDVFGFVIGVVLFYFNFILIGFYVGL